MAGLEALASAIYHEKQQPGSMLCAQHALNSLLQGNYFTAPDLSLLAENLDNLEGSHLDEQATESRNMDDTGFFSVQVLEKALEVWGLNLVRWRSEEMRPYHDHPHTQLAFILNLEQHWFTVRRFGPAVPNLEADPGIGHWFNLNSFLSAPEWVGKLYLGMVLQQAESEGYSVFAVTQANPQQPLALPRVLADEIAETLPEPSSASSSSNTSFRRTLDTSEAPHPSTDNLDEEDYELQAALQASLMASRSTNVSSEDMYDDGEVDEEMNPPFPPPSVPRPVVPLPHSVAANAFSTGGSSSGAQTPQTELDPVAASMARNRQLLERMRQEQEHAQRELWSEADLDPEEAEALQQRREARRRQEEEEEEMLRRAIEESERTYREHTSKRPEDEDEEIEELESAGAPYSASAFTPAYYSSDRVYDDDDAELQAALKASLEHVPAGYQHPNFEEPPQPVHTSSTYPTSGSNTATPASISSKDREENASIASTEASANEAPEPEVEEQLSVDEIRRRRLARFGL